MTTGLTVRVYESLDDLETLRPAWEKLLEDIPTASIFNTWEWLSCWWRAFGQNQELVALAMFDSPGRLVGLAPLSFSRIRVAPGLSLRICRLLGDGTADSDNLDILAQPEMERTVVSCMIDELLRCKRRWDYCGFNTIPAKSAFGIELLKQLKDLGWPIVREVHPWSVVELANNWPSYLATLSKKEADKLAYYRRRIEKRYQARFFRCDLLDELDKCLNALYNLHQQRWSEVGEQGSFASAARRAFYAEMARAFLSKGWLQFWLLELNGKICAAQFTFRYRNTVYALQEGFDPSFSSDSIGFVLRGAAIQSHIEEGASRYDFLMGKDPSKARWGAKDEYYQSIRFAMPFSLGSLFLQVNARAKAGKEQLRSRLSSRSWSSLKWVKNMLLRPRETEVSPSSGTPSMANQESSSRRPNSSHSPSSE